MGQPDLDFDLSQCETLDEVCAEVFYVLIEDGPELSSEQMDTFNAIVARWMFDNDYDDVSHDFNERARSAFAVASKRRIDEALTVLHDEGCLVQNPDTGMYRPSKLSNELHDLGVI